MVRPLVWLTVLMAASVGRDAMAHYITPPEPLRIAFEPGTARLSAAGRIAVDRLAVRGVRCKDGPLHVVLRHARASPAVLVAARAGVVRAHVTRLGLAVSYEAQPVASRVDAMDAVVLVNGDEYCDRENSAALSHWAKEMADYVAGRTTSPPTFWTRMSRRVRQQDLALPLAVAAYCGTAQQACARDSAVLEWLTDRVARDAPRDVRHHWLQRFWVLAADADLARLQTRLAVPGLDAMDRSCLLAEIGRGDLPWDTLEQRVMQPDLVALLRGRSGCFISDALGPFIAAAVKNRRLDVVARLIVEATMGDKAKLLSFAIPVAAGLPDEGDYEAALDHLAVMVRGVYRARNAELVVDWGTATAHLLVGAHCPQVAGWATAPPSRYARAWARLIPAGFVPAPDVLDMLTTKGLFESPHRCRLERVPGAPWQYQPTLGS
jgi:hypothetical protein